MKSVMEMGTLRFLAALFFAAMAQSTTFAGAESGHRFIACGHGTKTINIVNARGETEWTHPAGGQCNDLTRLTNGNVVWAHTEGASEVTPDHRVVWSYRGPKGTEIHTAQPLADGRVLIMQCGSPARLMEIDRASGAVVKELVIPTEVKKVHDQFRVIRKTPQGTYLVPHLGERKVVEYSGDGAVIRTFPANKPFFARRLPNGHTLISGGDAHYISEVDVEGREVWRVEEKELPGNQLLYVTSLQRLPNGNTIVANWPGHNRELRGKQPQVFEITREKRIVWAFQDWKNQGMFSTVQVLDDDVGNGGSVGQGGSKEKEKGGPRSPLALVADPRGEVVYIAEATAARVAEVDVATGAVRREIRLPGDPAALAFDRGTGLLAVAGGGVRGAVWLVDSASGLVRETLTAGHTPSAVVFSSSGKRLYVANRFDGTVQMISTAPGDASTGEGGRLKTGREPVALELTPDGRTLVVAHLLPEGRSDTGDVAAEVLLVDAEALRPISTIRLPNGSTGVRGVAVSPDGCWAYVTHVLGRYQSPTTQLERGWMNTNAVTLIDLRARRRRATVLLDSVEQGAANPWGVACSADAAWLVVTHSGSHEVSVIDRAGLHRKLEAAGADADPVDDLDFLAGLQRRVRVDGLGPRGVAICGDHAYSVLYYSDMVAGVPLATAAPGKTVFPFRYWTLGSGPALTAERRGEIAFHDASRCFQRWQSCASCHPDGRVDALNWDLMNDGFGNPKNTKSMFTSHATAPAMWLGVRPNAEGAVRSGFKHIQYSVVDESTAKDVDRYLARLPAVPSPHLVEGKLSASARRGEKLFGTLGCVQCHPAPLYTNKERYDIGTARGMDAGRAVDVPSLLEGWRTAPYLHDGSAATMREVLSARNPDQRHGDCRKLTAGEWNDLIDFLLSI